MAPLDAVRAFGLRLAARCLGPSLGTLMARPELRIAVFGSVGIAVALLLTLVCPLLLLAVSPLVLGVPHLVADVRYLVAKPRYHRRLWLALPVGLALALAAFGQDVGQSISLAPKAGLLAVGVTLLVAGRDATGQLRIGRRVLGLGLLGGLLAIGKYLDWYWIELGLAHAHNFVAVLLFYLMFGRGRDERSRLHAWPLLIFIVGSALLISGALSASSTGLAAFGSRPGLDADGQRAILSPLLSLPWATRLLLLFAFAQAVHYSMWLRLIPEAARERRAPRPYRASLRALRLEMGWPLLALAAIVGTALAIWATVDLLAARNGYFRIALFHGYLELCVLALWFVEGTPRARIVQETPRARNARRGGGSLGFAQ